MRVRHSPYNRAARDAVLRPSGEEALREFCAFPRLPELRSALRRADAASGRKIIASFLSALQANNAKFCAELLRDADAFLRACIGEEEENGIATRRREGIAARHSERIDA